MNVPIAIMIIAAAIIIVLGQLFVFSRWYRKAKSGEALLRKGGGATKVSFGGIIVIPMLQQLEKVDLTKKIVQFEGGPEVGIKTKEGTPVTIAIELFVAVNADERSVLLAADQFGAKNTFDDAYVQRYFQTRLIESTRSVIAQKSSHEIDPIPNRLKMEILEWMGKSMNGYVIDDIAIRSLHVDSLKDKDIEELTKP